MNRMPFAVSLLTLLAALLIAGPSLADEPPDVPEIVPPQVKPEVADSGAGDAADEEVSRAALALVDELRAEVEKARGLTFKEDFTRTVVTPDEVRVLVKEMMDKEIPPEKLRMLTALYARLGFFPTTLDFKDSLSELLGAGAAGFYDPEEKALFLVKGFSVEGSRIVIFHEMIHALEDQYYDLTKMQGVSEEDSDRGSAYQAVVEGSATWLMNLYAMANPDVQKAMMADMINQARQQLEMIQKVPVVIIAGMGIYPYGNAPLFVQRATGNDVSRIAELYEDVPVSTEQVLHPKKYQVDYPYQVEVADVTSRLPEGWERVYDDSIGELQMGLLLNEFLGGPPAMKLVRIMSLDSSVVFRGPTGKAVAGWDGDRVAAFSGPEGAFGFVWASRWDTPEDAREFAAAYRAGQTYKRETLKFTDWTAQIEVRGDRVLVVEGFPAETLYDVIDQSWKSTTFKVDRRDAADVEAVLNWQE